MFIYCRFEIDNWKNICSVVPQYIPVDSISCDANDIVEETDKFMYHYIKIYTIVKFAQYGNVIFTIIREK